MTHHDHRFSTYSATYCIITCIKHSRSYNTGAIAILSPNLPKQAENDGNMVFSVVLVFVNTVYRRESTPLILWDHPIAGWPPFLAHAGRSGVEKNAVLSTTASGGDGTRAGRSAIATLPHIPHQASQFPSLVLRQLGRLPGFRD